MEFRFKSRVIFTVEADTEQEALQHLMDATGEPLIFYHEDSKTNIVFNTMSAFEGITRPIPILDRIREEDSSPLKHLLDY